MSSRGLGSFSRIPGDVSQVVLQPRVLGPGGGAWAGFPNRLVTFKCGAGMGCADCQLIFKFENRCCGK